jgi:trans-aconitate 2-methyltransferase
VSPPPAQANGPRDWDGATYDRIADPMTRWGADVLARLPLRGDETVLDAGCGSGRVTEMLLRRLPRGHVVALDAAPSMLVEARRRLASFADRVTFVEADLLALDIDALPGRTPVDAVLSTATFHWVLDHDRLFANLASVMAPGARVVAQCGAAGNIAGLLEAVASTGAARAGTWLYATPDDTEARLGRAGFEDIEVWTHLAPTRFERRDELETFLETVCLRAHLADMAPTERARVLQAVADAMPEPVIDYVRLNISACRRVDAARD